MEIKNWPRLLFGSISGTGGNYWSLSSSIGEKGNSVCLIYAIYAMNFLRSPYSSKSGKNAVDLR